MKRQCLVRGNKVYFYGKTARLIQAAAKAEKISPQEWFTAMMTRAIKALRKIA